MKEFHRRQRPGEGGGERGEAGLARVFAAAGCVVFASAVVNSHLDQDPFAASLNWQAPHLDIHPEWGHGIENHEQLFYSVKHQVFYASGAGVPLPAELKDEFPNLQARDFDDYRRP